MVYDFDPDWFANEVAKNMKEGYSIVLAVFEAIIQYPPLVDAIVKGIRIGGKHEATQSKPT